MHHSPLIANDLILRSTTPGFEHRIWKVVRTSYGRWGQIVEVQNSPQEMESRPSRVKVDYLIKIYKDNETIYPSIREAVQLLNGNTEFELEVDGVRKTASEWRIDKNKTTETMKNLGSWGNGE